LQSTTHVDLVCIYISSFICSRQAYTAYRSVRVSYSACCSGYGGSSCHGRQH